MVYAFTGKFEKAEVENGTIKLYFENGRKLIQITLNSDAILDLDEQMKLGDKIHSEYYGQAAMKLNNELKNTKIKLVIEK